MEVLVSPFWQNLEAFSFTFMSLASDSGLNLGSGIDEYQFLFFIFLNSS